MGWIKVEVGTAKKYVQGQRQYESKESGTMGSTRRSKLTLSIYEEFMRAVGGSKQNNSLDEPYTWFHNARAPPGLVLRMDCDSTSGRYILHGGRHVESSKYGQWRAIAVERHGQGSYRNSRTSFRV